MATWSSLSAIYVNMDIPHMAVPHSCLVIIIIITIMIFHASIVSTAGVDFHAMQEVLFLIAFIVSLRRLVVVLLFRHSDQWTTVLHTANATSREQSVAAHQLLVLMLMMLLLRAVIVSILGALVYCHRFGEEKRVR